MGQLTEVRRFLFLLAGGRPNGNTEALARCAAERLPGGVEQRWIDLNEMPLPAFRDERHADGDTLPGPRGNEQVLLDATIACSDLVIVSPVYWGSLAAPAKLYLDHTVSWVRMPGVELRDRMRGKTLWGAGALSGPGLEDAQPMIDLLLSAADYLDMRFGGVLLGNGNRPGDVLNDSEAMARAHAFFAGVKNV